MKAGQMPPPAACRRQKQGIPRASWLTRLVKIGKLLLWQETLPPYIGNDQRKHPTSTLGQMLGEICARGPAPHGCPLTHTPHTKKRNTIGTYTKQSLVPSQPMSTTFPYVSTTL